MKKLYMVGLFLIAASLTGCTLKGPVVPNLSTGDVLPTTETEITGVVTTWLDVVWTELTGILDTGSVVEGANSSIDSWVVPMVAGSEDAVAQQSGVAAQIQKLIDERNAQPKDDSKLNEEDIDFMQKIINLFK